MDLCLECSVKMELCKRRFHRVIFQSTIIMPSTIFLIKNLRHFLLARIIKYFQKFATVSYTLTFAIYLALLAKMFKPEYCLFYAHCKPCFSTFNTIVLVQFCWNNHVKLTLMWHNFYCSPYLRK